MSYHIVSSITSSYQVISYHVMIWHLAGRHLAARGTRETPGGGPGTPGRGQRDPRGTTRGPQGDSPRTPGGTQGDPKGDRDPGGARRHLKAKGAKKHRVLQPSSSSATVSRRRNERVTSTAPVRKRGGSCAVCQTRRDGSLPGPPEPLQPRAVWGIII